MPSTRIRFAASAALRGRLAREFLSERRDDESLLLLLPHVDVARPWLAGRATFGWQRATLPVLASELAARPLAVYACHLIAFAALANY